MSFILDALRKSEHARDARALPGFVDAPIARASRARLPWILGGLGVLLGVNLAVLLWVLARPAAAPLGPPATAASPRPSSPVASSVIPPAAPPAASRSAPLVRPLAAEAEGGDPELEPAEPPSAPRRAGAELRPAPVPAPMRERRVASTASAAAAATSDVPSIHQLPAQATAGLPTLSIDLHVYSGDPAQRFAIINGQPVHEGTALKEGPTVERITADGAVLNYNGTRFLLPRQ
ncbi:MAG: general secretion pathway protein GspB [Proteobacteria bacterium]|nr:general secretion pathway protein GspB [Pseudomonadota bacterium]